MKRKAEAMRKHCAPCCSSWFSSHGCYLGGHCRSRGELRQHIMHASTSTASVGAVDRPSVLPTPCSSVSDRNPHAFSIPSSLASFVRACARRSLQTTNLETCQRKMLARLFALLLAVAPAASCECDATYPTCHLSGPNSGWCEGDPAVEQWCTTPLVCNRCGGKSGASCTSSYPSSSPPPPSPPPPSPPPPVPVPPPPSPPPPSPPPGCTCGADYPTCIPLSAPSNGGWCEGDPAIDRFKLSGKQCGQGLGPRPCGASAPPPAPCPDTIILRGNDNVKAAQGGIRGKYEKTGDKTNGRDRYRSKDGSGYWYIYYHSGRWVVDWNDVQYDIDSKVNMQSKYDTTARCPILGSAAEWQYTGSDGTLKSDGALSLVAPTCTCSNDFRTCSSSSGKCFKLTSSGSRPTLEYAAGTACGGPQGEACLNSAPRPPPAPSTTAASGGGSDSSSDSSTSSKSTAPSPPFKETTAGKVASALSNSKSARKLAAGAIVGIVAGALTFVSAIAGMMYKMKDKMCSSNETTVTEVEATTTSKDEAAMADKEMEVSSEKATAADSDRV